MPLDDRCFCWKGELSLGESDGIHCKDPSLTVVNACYMRSLHERPISGTGNVDLVIYAAQLSQSFFSCLAGAVEGFLDLFFVNSETPMNGKDDRSLEDTASMLSSSSRHVPPGALASIVLWCDSELSKFSSAFSGTRILGNLALSPPPRQEPSIPKVRMVGFEDEASQTNKERQVSGWV